MSFKKNTNCLLPNVIIAGFQKCGTTAAAANLATHPEIFTPNSNTKLKLNDTITYSEMHYFNEKDRYKLGIEWYSSFFYEGRNSKIRIDKTPNYATSPEAPQRIKHTLPKVKILFLIRNPINRFLSAWNHFRYDNSSNNNWGSWTKQFASIDELIFGNYNGSFKPKIEIFFRDGRYSSYIESYIKLFSKQNIHIVFTENLLNNPQHEYDNILKFLDIQIVPIKNSFIHSREYPKENVTSQRTYEFLRNYYHPYNAELESMLNIPLPESWK